VPFGKPHILYAVRASPQAEGAGLHRAEVMTMWKICACVCLALGMAACASAPATPQPPKAAANQPPVGCVPATASRLPQDPNACGGFGRSYSKDELDRTGQPYLNDSLRTLDPSITTHGP
jgi:hypothetical protein